MKGIIFSFKKSSLRNSSFRFPATISDFKYFLKKYGVHTFFVAMLLSGLALGTVYSSAAQPNFLDSIDFLFLTNLEARLSQNTIDTFCACFASDFLFLLIVFLLGLAPWGIPFLPLIVIFRGFGTGLTAGYLSAVHSLKGGLFYLFIILPGTFLFCMSLVSLSSNSFYLSKQMLLHTISKQETQKGLRKHISHYTVSCISSLIMAFLSAVLDTVLWMLFAGNFNF